MTRKRTKEATPPVQPVNPAAYTPEQIEAAQEAAQQRVRTQFAVLKQRFAEVDVDRTIAEAERDQLFQQLQAAQKTIEQLTASLAEATKTPNPEKAEKAKQAEKAAEED